MSKFEINEVAFWTGDIPTGADSIHGVVVTPSDVTILSALVVGPYGPSHYCDIPGDPSPKGMGWVIPVSVLRKKRPPQENQDIAETRQKGTGDWDLMPWRPVKELEEVE